MKERPILFSGPMVRAILDGRKVQTRRLFYGLDGSMSVYGRGYPRGFSAWEGDRDSDGWPLAFAAVSGAVTRLPCPYGAPGDRLWVRETWYCDHCFERDYERTRETYVGRVLTDDECEAEWKGNEATGSLLYYRADGEAHQQFEQLEHDSGRIWKPSIHMPRWASRLNLEVTEVRVQRLQEISEDDARAEGVQAVPFCKAGRPAGQEHVEAFEDLWTSINGERTGCAWQNNPWVWAITFKRVDGQ